MIETKSKEQRAIDMLTASRDRKAAKYKMDVSILPKCYTKQELLEQIAFIEEQGKEKLAYQNEKLKSEEFEMVSTPNVKHPFLQEKSDSSSHGFMPIIEAVSKTFRQSQNSQQDKPVSKVRKRLFVPSLYPEKGHNAVTEQMTFGALALSTATDNVSTQVKLKVVESQKEKPSPSTKRDLSPVPREYERFSNREVFRPPKETIELPYSKSDGIQSSHGMQWYIAKELVANPDLQASKPPDLEQELNTPEPDKQEEQVDTKPRLSDEELKKRADQTARSVLSIYSVQIPKIFKYFAKFDDGKLEDMEMAGEIDMSMKLGSGKTFRQHKNEMNAMVDKVFTTSPETMEALQEPLAEMLAEKGWVLSPMGQIILGFANDLVDKLEMTIQIHKDHKRMIKAMAFRSRNK